MSEKPLLLSEAKSGVLVEDSRPFSRATIAGASVVVFFALVGGGNIAFSFFSSGFQSAPPEGSATSSPAPASAGIIPERLVIPSLGIDAPVEHVGVNAKGNMATPSGYERVAWYKDGTLPGDIGNAVIAGHLDNSLGFPGVFESLNRLSLGERIEVVGKDGERVAFVVKRMTVYDAAKAPAQEIFGGDGVSSQLVLITCNGAWDNAQKSYEKRLVLIAERE